MPANLYRTAVPEDLWARIRDEFALPSLEQVQVRLSAMHEDPGLLFRQLVRVFMDEGTYCPGFQFHPDLSLNRVVVELFQRAMALRIPHNYFTRWMMSPCPALQGKRPVDLRETGDAAPLLTALQQSLPGAAA